MTKEQALSYLRTWPRWTEPKDKWVRQTLVRCGTARPNDTVTHSVSTMPVVPEHERSTVALLRSLGRIAGVQRVDLVHHRSRCGTGHIDKRIARVVVRLESELVEDDFFVRLDIEHPEARQAMNNHAMNRKVG
jgi:hypothetical protein